MTQNLSEKRKDFLKKDFEQGFINHCQFKAGKIDDGHFQSTVVIQDHHRQQDGFVHAGVMATMADHTAGYSAFTTVHESFQILSIEFKINFLKPAHGKMLECCAKVIRRGRQIIIAESEVFDIRENTKQAVAKAIVTLMAVPRAKLMGEKTRPQPVKKKQSSPGETGGRRLNEQKRVEPAKEPREKMELQRCPWAESDPAMIKYHDHEWGVPVHDDRLLFEFLILESAQAGLSWSTILKKRPAYKEAFDNFEPEKIAGYSDMEIDRLMADPDIVKNRMKINSAVSNARAFLKVKKKYGSFDKFIWSFVGGSPVQNRWSKTEDIPSKTDESKAMAEALKKNGFKFVGPVICYAFMQAVGMVNDHTIHCFRHKELS